MREDPEDNEFGATILLIIFIVLIVIEACSLPKKKADNVRFLEWKHNLYLKETQND